MNYPTPRPLTVTREFVFAGSRYYLSVDHDSMGRPIETWSNGPRNECSLTTAAKDACELISMMLKRFISPETLAGLIRRKDDGNAESIIGEIILQIVQSP